MQVNPPKTKSILLLSILLVLLYGSFCKEGEKQTATETTPPPKTKEPEAVVLFIVGDVTILGRKLNLGDRLQVGEVLETGPKAMADLQILGESEVVIRLKENSKFDLKRYESEAGTVHEADLQKGVALFTIKKQQKNQSFNVRTPTFVAGVRGTQFSVQTASDGKSKIDVLDGSVAVKPRIELVEAIGEAGLEQLGIQNPVTEIIVEKGKSSEVSTKDIEKIEKASGIAELKKLPELQTLTASIQNAENPDEKRAQMKIEIASALQKQEVKDVIKEKERTPAPKPFVMEVKKVSESEVQKQIQEFEELIAVEQKKIEKQLDSKAIVQERNKSMEKILMTRIQKITKKSTEKLILKDGRELEGVIFQDDDFYYVLTPQGTEKIPEAQVEGLGF